MFNNLQYVLISMVLLNIFNSHNQTLTLGG
jgi:hypothetical protein